jgi:hypothetical protein
MLRRRNWFLASIAAILAAGVVVHASDPVGVYARIDKVVMEPDERAPQRIQVWGVFAIADPRNGNDYLPARRGYLHFSAPADPTLALREWSDLKSVAGTSQIVAFGSRWRPLPKLREAGEPPAPPDPYAVNIGVMKIHGRTGYAPVRSVLEFTR